MMYLTAHQSPDYFSYNINGFQMMPYQYMYQSPAQFHGLYVQGQTEGVGDMTENGQANDQSRGDLSKM